MLKTTIKPFGQLTTSELYALLQLRSEVFVVEQDCAYQDVDGKDQNALHVLGYKGEELVAYTRIFKPGDYFKEASVGRVVVKKTERKNDYGRAIMKTSITAVKTEYNTHRIKISAQLYLKKFYNSLGFEQVGEGYLEDGIPHIAMINKSS